MTAPALSWDAVFNITKVELVIISDADMYLFIEKGMRGGVFYIFVRCSKANDKYFKSNDPKQELKHIKYLHPNNLYRHAMSKIPQTG